MIRRRNCWTIDGKSRKRWTYDYVNLWCIGFASELQTFDSLSVTEDHPTAELGRFCYESNRVREKRTYPCNDPRRTVLVNCMQPSNSEITIEWPCTLVYACIEWVYACIGWVYAWIEWVYAWLWLIYASKTLPWSRQVTICVITCSFDTGGSSDHSLAPPGGTARTAGDQTEVGWLLPGIWWLNMDGHWDGAGQVDGEEQGTILPKSFVDVLFV